MQYKNTHTTYTLLTKVIRTIIANTMQKRTIVKSLFLLLLISGGINTQTYAQSEVDVEKPYEPAIEDAFKISKMPQISDTTQIDVSFEYDIMPSPFLSFFTPDNIKPARLKSEEADLLDNGFVRGGFGNYLSPILEIRAHSKRSAEHHWNAYLLHESVNGKITNQYDKKQYAGYSSNKIGAHGKKMLPTAVAYAKIDFDNRKTYYFGKTLDDELANVRTTEFEKKDLKALPVNSFSTKLGINSTHMDSAHLNYRLYAKLRHTNAKTTIKEDKTNIGADLDYYFNKQFIGTRGKITYLQTAGLNDTLEHVYIDFNPWIGAFGKKWRIQAGVNTSYDQKTAEYYFYPDVKLHYNIVSFIMVPYFEYSGNYQLNTYKNITDENHFVLPSLYVKPTNYKNIISGGLRGNVSSRLGFNLNATYNNIEDQYFYIDADTTQSTQYFDVEYDNLTQMKFMAEVSWKKSETFNVLVQATYNQYSLDSLSQPYYMPIYEINTHLRYNIKNKIILTSDLFYKGERYAHDLRYGDIHLKDIIDLNVGGEYLYNHYLSAFVQFNNILAQKRFEWNNYRLLGFRVTAGATYRF
ncbi:MAG: hypothetical protein PF489_04565 [Salinivirgaceae bacterium]|jgi:hypothetical protein|nr:hypothetical protein [Salinivirgaceae bacterium]